MAGESHYAPAPDPRSAEDLTDEEIAAREDPHNAANRTAINEKRKRIKNKAGERAEVVKSLLSIPAGADFLAWLICDIGGMLAPVANREMDQQFAMFREGQRAVAIVLHNECLRNNNKQYMDALGRHLAQGIDYAT